MQSARSEFAASRVRAPRRRARRSRTSRGFTLFEMLLVLAVLAAAIAISWPALSRSYQSQRIRQSAEEVQVRIMATRVHALDTGLTYQFRYEPGGRRFVGIPAEQDVEGSDAAATPKVSGMLPETVQFVAETHGLTTTHLSDNDLKGIPNLQLFHGANWGPAILFRPDGTATAADVNLTDKQKQLMRLSIRALTGGVTISTVQRD